MRSFLNKILPQTGASSAAAENASAQRPSEGTVDVASSELLVEPNFRRIEQLQALSQAMGGIPLETEIGVIRASGEGESARLAFAKGLTGVGLIYIKQIHPIVNGNAAAADVHEMLKFPGDPEGRLTPEQFSARIGLVPTNLRSLSLDDLLEAGMRALEARRLPEDAA